MPAVLDFEGAGRVKIVGSGVTTRNAGADLVLLHTEQDWVDQARQVVDGKGVHLAVDGIGGQMLAKTLGCVRPFGIVASLDQPAGPIPAVRVEDLGFTRSIALMRPSSMAYANDPVLYHQGARDLLAALEDGLSNPIGAEYSLQVALHSVFGLSLASSFRNSGGDVLPPGAFRVGARRIKEGHGNRLPCTAFSRAEAEEPGRSPGC